MPGAKKANVARSKKKLPIKKVKAASKASGLTLQAAAKSKEPVEKKEQITLRIDADVVDHFRAMGSGYQGKMQGYLQVMMEQEEFRTSVDDPGEAWVSENPSHGSMRSRLFKPRKEQISLRLDSELMRYFRASGKGYQTKMNRALRLVMVELISNAESNEEEE